MSPLGAVTLRILAAAAKSNWGANFKPSISQEDISCLEKAAQLALQNGPLVPHDGRNMGGDELLFGRTGLLWALLNIRARQYDDETQNALAPVLDLIPKILDTIIDSGRQCSKLFIEKSGKEEAHPLMYAWMEGHYCFGT